MGIFLLSETAVGEKGVGETPVSPWRKAASLRALENLGFPKSGATTVVEAIVENKKLLLGSFLFI